MRHPGDVTAFLTDADGGEAATAAGAVWIADSRLERVDPATNRLAAVLDVGGVVDGVAATDQTAWRWSAPPEGGGDSLVRVDSSANRVSGRLAIGNSSMQVAVDVGAVWLAGYWHGLIPALVRVDPRSLGILAITPLPVVNPPPLCCVGVVVGPDAGRHR